MAALFSTPGPVEMFVKPRINGSLASSFLYLGTAVTDPEVEIKPAFIPVMNSLGGRSVPTIRLNDGEEHEVSVTLNRFDWYVYNQLKSHQAIPTTTPTGEALLRGRIWTGVSDFMFLFVNSYAGTVADTGQMPDGRLYFFGTLVGSRESSTGSRVSEISLVMLMQGGLNTTTRLFELYTENSTAWGTVTVK